MGNVWRQHWICPACCSTKQVYSADATKLASSGSTRSTRKQLVRSLWSESNLYYAVFGPKATCTTQYLVRNMRANVSHGEPTFPCL